MSHLCECGQQPVRNHPTAYDKCANVAMFDVRPSGLALMRVDLPTGEQLRFHLSAKDVAWIVSMAEAAYRTTPQSSRCSGKPSSEGSTP